MIKLVDLLKETKTIIKEDLFSNLEASGNLQAPTGGSSLIGKSYTLSGGTKYDNMFFLYDPKSPKPFGLIKVAGHGLNPNYLGGFGLRGTQSNVAGVDEFIFDGNYNPKYFDEKTFGDIVNHFKGGLDREAKAQSSFYKDYFSGGYSGTID